MINIDKLKHYWDEPVIDLIKSLKKVNLTNDIILWHDGINVLFEEYIDSCQLLYDFDKVYVILGRKYLDINFLEDSLQIKLFSNILQSILKRNLKLDFSIISWDCLSELKKYYE